MAERTPNRLEFLSCFSQANRRLLGDPDSQSGSTIQAGIVEGRDFISIDNEHVIRPLSKIGDLLRGNVGMGWTTAMAFSSLAYYSFELELWRKLGARIEAANLI